MLRFFTSSGLFLLCIFLILASPRTQALTEKERDQLRLLPEWLPYVSCQDNRMLRQCITWTTETCELAIASSAQSCLNLNKNQWVRPEAQTFEDWQEKISLCVFRDIKNQYRKDLVDSILCKNKGVTK